MKTLSLSEAKMKLSGLVNTVSATDEEGVLTKNGRPAPVLVSPSEFEGWKETIRVRSDSRLMDEIRKRSGHPCSSYYQSRIQVRPSKMTSPVYVVSGWEASELFTELLIA